jgi:phosphoserine phosphatase
MNGEIDFSESFKQRMALLEGLKRYCKQLLKIYLLPKALIA